MGFETYKTTLEGAAKRLTKPARVVLLADRGFVDHRLFRLARDLGWNFHFRLKSSIYVGLAVRKGATVGELMPEKGYALSLLALILSTNLCLVSTGTAVMQQEQRHCDARRQGFAPSKERA